MDKTSTFVITLGGNKKTRQPLRMREVQNHGG
jgi:hypothetical protein